MPDAIRNPSGSNVSNMAAMMTPMLFPMPPKMTITTSVMDCMKPNPLGVRNCFECAYNPPATPAKNAPTTNALTLYFVVLIPIASAATSSSRTAMNPRPYVELTSDATTYTVTAARPNAQ